MELPLSCDNDFCLSPLLKLEEETSFACSALFSSPNHERKVNGTCQEKEAMARESCHF